MQLIFQGIYTTATITFVAITCGLLLALILAVIRVAEIPLLNQIAKLYINIFRSLPLVMVLLGFYLAAPGLIRNLFNITGDVRLLSALIAFSLFEAAYFAEIIRSGLNSVGKNQINAARAMGFTTLQAYRYILLPQALRNTFPVLLTQSIILFQDTSLVYVIGLVDFFGAAIKLGDMQSSKTQMILAVSFAYFVICFTLQRISNKVQKKLAV